MSTTRGTQMTVAEIAALVGLIAVIVMSVIMAIEIVRGGVFEQTHERRPVAVESGAMAIGGEARDVK